MRGTNLDVSGHLERKWGSFFVNAYSTTNANQWQCRKMPSSLLPIFVLAISQHFSSTADQISIFFYCISLMSSDRLYATTVLFSYLTSEQ